MKKLLLLFISLVLLVSCGSGKWPTEKFATKNNYQGVIGDLGGETSELHKLPMYPGGKQGINDFIIKITRYPDQAREKDLHGRVVIKYIVRKDGYVTDLEVLESAHPLLDAEALRVIGTMERWIPGQHEGETVRVMFRQPFRF